MITIYFSCEGCGLVKQPLQVPAREDPETEAVIPWMNQTTAIISEEHRRLSPNCTAKELKNIMIPLEGAEFVGQQVE
jgi:hypothetical protein